jgi:ABC-type transport system substrate-binding protein
VLAPFESDDAYRIIVAPPGSAMDAPYWNLGRGGALADPAFRHAYAKAIDRQDIVERLFGGNGTPGNPGWMPPGNEFHVEVEQYPFHLEAAKSITVMRPPSSNLHR